MAGRFLTVEGGEGVGKSTFISQLVQNLREVHDLEVVQTFEPGGTPLANRYREIFTAIPSDESMFVETEFLTVAAARAQHVRHLVSPALAADKWVICDRYCDSSRVYQGALGGINRARIDEINDFATNGLVPNLTLLLDCDVEISLARVTKRADTTSTEKSRFDAQPPDYHQQIRQAFLDLADAEKDRFVVINAALMPEEAVAQAVEHLAARGWL